MQTDARQKTPGDDGAVRARAPRQGPLASLYPLATVACWTAASLAAAESGIATDSTIFADLPIGVRDSLEQAGSQPRETRQWLQLILDAAPAGEVDRGSVVLRADARWSSRPVDDGPGAPLVELRRWPGDTVLTLYAVDPNDGPPPIAGASLIQTIAEPERVEWRGTVDGLDGRRPALWVERQVVADAPRLGALLLPGDAGLGSAAVADLTEEGLFVLSRVEIREPGWRAVSAVARGGAIRLPELGRPPGDGDERATPWQAVAGDGFTLGLPPGVRVAPSSAEAPAGQLPDGSVLWLRGRYRDLDGTRVELGDGARVGYVARVEANKPWSAGKQPPLAVPEGRQEASRVFVLAEEQTGARSARAERWREGGFDGDWLVFRLDFGDVGYEIGLPVVDGWRSPSLFHIASSYRAEGMAPAPAPVGPAERFGIRFQPLTAEQRDMFRWLEGYLFVPGLQAEVARGWVPLANRQSVDGYPLSFLDRQGQLLATLTRVEPDGVDTAVASLAGAAELAKPKKHRAARVLVADAGPYLFVADAGHAFLFEPSIDTGDEAAREAWQTMMRSVRLVRP